MCYIGILIPFFGEFCGVESCKNQLNITGRCWFATWELGWWPSGKKTLVMTMSPVERVCVSQSTMTGLCGGWGLGEERLVAADRMFSSFSIRSILRERRMKNFSEATRPLSYLSRFPLARISSTICIDSARLTGPLPNSKLSQWEEDWPVTTGSHQHHRNKHCGGEEQGLTCGGHAGRGRGSGCPHASRGGETRLWGGRTGVRQVGAEAL